MEEKITSPKGLSQESETKQMADRIFLEIKKRRSEITTRLKGIAKKGKKPQILSCGVSSEDIHDLMAVPL